MSEFTPYQIEHIHLEEHKLNFPTSITQNKGYYVVFWWRQIAIGDVYIPPNKNLSKESYLEALLKSITPSVSNYADNFESTLDWKSLILQNKVSEWFTFMDNIYNPIISSTIPDSVSVSVIICTRNRPDNLKRCLQMLNKLTCAAREIIVIDNAPDDNSSFEVVKAFQDVNYIREPRKGLDIARNTGVLSASQPIVTFVDDDVTVHPLCIYRIWETFEDSTVVAMTGLVIASELQTEAQLLFEKYCSFNRGYRNIFYDQSFISSNTSSGPPVWNIGAGANMAFRKSIFDTVGLFDERLDVGAAGCSGDSEMWYRILADGYCIHYNPRAIAYHEHRKKMDSLKKQLYSYMRGHTAAALIQHNFKQPAKYKKRIFINLPKYYLKLLVRGFPKYQDRYQTIGAEMKGMLSGLLFYIKNRNVPAQKGE